MTEVTTLYGLLAVIITSIGTPITLHYLQGKKNKKISDHSDKKLDDLILKIK